VIDAFKAVLWSFFGIRRSADYDADARKLRPRDVIAAGLVSAVVFVLVLFGIVKFVTR
jgi:amino acid transporter